MRINAQTGLQQKAAARTNIVKEMFALINVQMNVHRMHLNARAMIIVYAIILIRIHVLSGG
jgi:hypothetical protein